MSDVQLQPEAPLVTQPVRAQYVIDTIRLTFVSDSSLRIEYDPSKRFEDRPGQRFINRTPANIEVRQERVDGAIRFTTSTLDIRCRPHLPSDSPELVEIEVAPAFRWQWLQKDTKNLGGTSRSLCWHRGRKNVLSGESITLRPGLISREGWTWFDETHSLVFGPDDIPIHRNAHKGYRDIYFFGHGNDYARAFKDFYAVAGRVPLIPRWALGIWWSRWWRYRQQDLIEIADGFAVHGAPLSVMVLDVAWHVVENEHHRGWTGYTWNKDYFPDHRAFLTQVHDRGMRCCLNLHPADGVHPHEEMYPAMARAMGMDPQTKHPVRFDISNPNFVKAYFDILHHPHEKDGIDFWWMDWQERPETDPRKLEPLWMLNHAHFKDMENDKDRRPMIFSRWAGRGAHRYPIGFSGDTYSCWETLAYLAYFTQTAGNVAFGWWSSDVGGFMRGSNDHELYVRWVQFAIVSPIVRFHNQGDYLLDARPWVKPEPYRSAALAALKLRQALVPYLYTAAYHFSTGGFPVISPMYYYSSAEEAFHCPHQYYFGSDIIAAPLLNPADASTRCARTMVWLPKGDWYDFFSARRYQGGTSYAVYGDIEKIPLFVKHGAIIATEGSDKSIQLRLYPGSDARGFFYDDDGESRHYEDGEYAYWTFTKTTEPGRTVVAISQSAGRWRPQRRLSLRFVGSAAMAVSKVHCNGKELDASAIAVDKDDVVISNIDCTDGMKIEVFTTAEISMRPRFDADDLKEIIKMFNISSLPMRSFFDQAESIVTNPALLKDWMVDFTPSQRRCLLEHLLDAGFEIVNTYDNTRAVFFWNNRVDSGFHAYISKREDWSNRSIPWDQTNGPSVHILRVRHDEHFFTVLAGYGDIATVEQHLNQ